MPLLQTNRMTIQIDLVYDIVIENIDINDYPHFCDAFIGSAQWKSNNEPLTDTELEDLMNSNPVGVYDLACQAWRDHWEV